MGFAPRAQAISTVLLFLLHRENLFAPTSPMDAWNVSQILTARIPRSLTVAMLLTRNVFSVLIHLIALTPPCPNAIALEPVVLAQPLQIVLIISILPTAYLIATHL